MLAVCCSGVVLALGAAIGPVAGKSTTRIYSYATETLGADDFSPEAVPDGRAARGAWPVAGGVCVWLVREFCSLACGSLGPCVR